MMNCETTKDLLIDLAYGELDELRQQAVRLHVESCSTCAAELHVLERGQAAAKYIAVVEPPAISAELLAAIEAHKPGRSVTSDSASGAATADGSGQRAAAKESSAKPTASTQSVPLGSTGAAAPQKTETDNAEVLEIRGHSRWIDRVAALAMRREVAMAAVFVVAVGVGITTLYSPSQRLAVSEESRAAGVVPAVAVEPDQDRAAAPSAPAAVAPRIRGVATDPNARPSDRRGQSEAASLVLQTTPSTLAGSTIAAGRASGGNETARTGLAESERAQGAADDRGAVYDQAAQGVASDNVARTNQSGEPQAFRQAQSAPAPRAAGTWGGSQSADMQAATQNQNNLAQTPSPTPAAAPPVAQAANYVQAQNRAGYNGVAQQNAPGASNQMALGNAGPAVAGVQREPQSANEIAAQAALGRGDTPTALAQLRLAYAAATDDVTRARLRRQIDSLTAANAEVNAVANNASATNAQQAPAAVASQAAQSDESVVRRPVIQRSTSPARSRHRNAMPSAADNFGNLGFKRQTH
jgi:hypothetical protein